MLLITEACGPLASLLRRISCCGIGHTLVVSFSLKTFLRDSPPNSDTVLPWLGFCWSLFSPYRCARVEIYHKCPAGGSAALEGRRTVSLFVPNLLVGRW